MNKETTTLELIPKGVDEQLEQCAKNIETFGKGEIKGAQEQFGYAFLRGRELLKAKAVIAHGNADPNAGLMNWVKKRFPNMEYRTATNRMVFAEGIMQQAGTLVSKKRPLLLSDKKLSGKDRAQVLELVPLVMDGKGMVEFMRASKLLADPLKPVKTPRKKVNAEAALAAQRKQAVRHWDVVDSQLTLGVKVLKHLDDADLQIRLDKLVASANAIRELQKTRKAK